jgi:hypothetical protein
MSCVLKGTKKKILAMINNTENLKNNLKNPVKTSQPYAKKMKTIKKSKKRIIEENLIKNYEN